MIRRVLTLVRKDFLIFLKDRVAIALGFAVPLVMILVFGLVFGGEGGNTLQELDVLAVNEDLGSAGARLLRSLDELDEIRILQSLQNDSITLDSVKARSRVAQGKASAALIVPRGFSDSLKSGQVIVYLLEDPRDPITAGVLTGMLQQQVFRTFPGVLPMSMMSTNFGDSAQSRVFAGDMRRAIERYFGVKFADTSSVGSMFSPEFMLGESEQPGKQTSTGFSLDSVFSRAVDIRRKVVVGQNIANPGIAQSVAGPAVMFMLFAVGAIGASLLREMRSGTAQRVLLSCATPGEMLCSKYAYAVTMGSIQLAVMMLYGWVIFDLDVFHHAGTLPIIIVCASAAMSAIGLITAAICRTEDQAGGLQVIVILGMSAIGGAMFPSFMIPEFVRSVASLTPVHWAMQGFLDVFWREQNLAGIYQECGVLLGMAVVMVWVAVLIFRRRLVREFS